MDCGFTVLGSNHKEASLYRFSVDATLKNKVGISIYLKGRATEHGREKQRDLSFAGSLPRYLQVRAGSGQSQQARTPCGSPTRVPGDHALEPSLAASQMAIAGSWT